MLTRPLVPPTLATVAFVSRQSRATLAAIADLMAGRGPQKVDLVGLRRRDVPGFGCARGRLSRQRCQRLLRELVLLGALAEQVHALRRPAALRVADAAG